MATTPDLPYAGFPQRFGAYLIDQAVSLCLILVFVFAVARPILFVVLFPEGHRPGMDPAAAWAALEASRKSIVFALFLFCALGVPALYYGALESSARRATLGKMALSLVTVRTDGSKVSFLRATARALLRLFILHLCPITFFGILPLFGNKRQGWHDMATGVVVLHRQKFAQGEPSSPMSMQQPFG